MLIVNERTSSFKMYQWQRSPEKNYYDRVLYKLERTWSWPPATLKYKVMQLPPTPSLPPPPQKKKVNENIQKRQNI